MLVGLAGGVANQLLTAPTYRSTSTVLFSLNRTGTISELADGNSYVQDLVPSYVKIAKMPIVLSPVIADLGLATTPRELADKITVTVEPASVVAQIGAVDTDPKVAAAIANGVADRLVQALTTLSPDSASQSAVISVTTLAEATPGAFPFSPNRNQNVAGGLLLGLIVGLVAVAVRESVVTQPLTTRAEIERVTDTPVIGSIVTDPRAANRPLPVSTHPTIARSESFRILQTTLGALRGEGRQCFVVISSLSGEGRSGVAANLAIAMAHTSREVLLIDADLRKSSIAQLLNIDNSKGLTSVLNATSTLESSIQTWVTQPWGEQGLDVLPAGPPVTNPSELVASRAMTWVLEEARKRYDVVILDSPPLLQSTDGALLSAQADYAVMIVDAPRTRQRHLVESLSRLRLAGADVLGLALNRTAPSSQLEYPASVPTVPRGAGSAPSSAGHAADRGLGRPDPLPVQGRPTAGDEIVGPAFAPVPTPTSATPSSTAATSAPTATSGPVKPLVPQGASVEELLPDYTSIRPLPADSAAKEGSPTEPAPDVRPSTKPTPDVHPPTKPTPDVPQSTKPTPDVPDSSGRDQKDAKTPSAKPVPAQPAPAAPATGAGQETPPTVGLPLKKPTG